MNVTSTETWMNLNQVLQTEDSMKIVLNLLMYVSFCSVLPPENWSD